MLVLHISLLVWMWSMSECMCVFQLNHNDTLELRLVPAVTTTSLFIYYFDLCHQLIIIFLYLSLFRFCLTSCSFSLFLPTPNQNVIAEIVRIDIILSVTNRRLTCVDKFFIMWLADISQACMTMPTGWIVAPEPIGFLEPTAKYHFQKNYVSWPRSNDCRDISNRIVDHDDNE